MAIRKFIEEYTVDEMTDLYSKARRLIGVVESGISDLGQNHRDHLIKKLKAQYDSDCRYRSVGGFDKSQ